ncbi:MAG TPA: HAMP domain-containing sensor histidine kinase [Vicinamibacteria bacterium]|nr:HAMP domain-containing sensor histidine kinase [Vicinamibacteria bacterium]
MSSRGQPAPHRSIFAKLVAITVVMAVSLVLMVAIFFRFIVDPTVATSADHMFGDYARAVAARSPGREEAKRIAHRLDLQIRYRGPDGDWATSDGLPTIDQVRDAANGLPSRPAWRPVWGRSRYLVPAPNGGTYLFSWEFGRRMQAAHDKLLWLLLCLIVAVIAIAHVTLRRALVPLRLLHDGVLRLSDGDLEVELPNRTRDEFGALTDAFNQMVRQVKEMLRARDRLLLDVSHELRSPLTRMKVALALLPDGEKKTGMAADVREMEAMITELLEIERLRDGRGIRTERRDLTPILREAASALQDVGAGVRLLPGASEILLDMDVDRVRAVLRNLVENALKYSLPDSRPVEVSACEQGDAVVVRVADDGPGIPEADLVSIFEPFYRVDRSRSKKTGGYGLGLSICKSVMEAHGGGIAVENRAPRGAVFTLTFKRPPA